MERDADTILKELLNRLLEGVRPPEAESAPLSPDALRCEVEPYEQR